MKTFKTERLPLAIYLCADGRLRFLGCERIAINDVEFVFHDPESKGAEFEFEFDRGALIPATAIFAAQKLVRRRMSDALEQRKIGEAKHGKRQGTTRAW